MKQIKLEKWTSAKDANGNFKESVVRYPMFAKVTWGGGSKGTTNGQTTLNETVTFNIGFRPNFKPTGNWRVVYYGRRYSVQSIERDREQRFHWNFIAQTK